MLLRRITKHVTDQNWFAVFIDFLIVVVGVFIGIQVANWNADLKDKTAYKAALERFKIEVEFNIDSLEKLHQELNKSIPLVTNGLDYLRTCDQGEDAIKAIILAVNEMQFTRGVRIRNSSLIELTTNADLLLQQNSDDRRAFQDLSYSLGIVQYESDYLEIKPMDNPIWANPKLTVDQSKIDVVEYKGNEWKFLKRELLLNASTEELCNDHSLRSQIYGWERLQSALASMIAITIGDFRTIDKLLIQKQIGTN